MTPNLPLDVSLRLGADVTLDQGAYWSQSDLPWLRLELGGPAPGGSWIEIIYSSGLLEPLVRPLLRFICEDRNHDAILPAALFGRGIWLGPVPDGTKELWISPTNRPGPFSFALEQIRVVKRIELVRRAIQRAPRYCLAGIGAHMLGLRYVAETQFRRALLPTRIDDYDLWRKARVREADLSGYEAPHCDWRQAPHIRLVASFGTKGPQAATDLAAQLRAQPYPHWSLALIDAGSTDSQARSLALSEGDRIVVVPGDHPAQALTKGLADHDLLAPIHIADENPAFAMAILAEAAQANPNANLFYGDEDFVGTDGKHYAPQFKPDWSPIYHQSSPYFGSAIFFRTKVLRQLNDQMTADAFTRAPGLATRDLIQAQDAVVHIRRIMRTRSDLPSDPVRAAPSSSPRRNTNFSAGTKPRATIIVPTKDRFELMKTCIESLRGTASFATADVVIVDNGSTSSNAKRFLADLAREDHFRVLPCPGPFNFAKLCNLAAALARAETLVFLNNDAEIINADWLDALLAWTHLPDVGAVGAKLLYPNGLLQHAGVVLGTDNCAAHFQRMLRANDAGYFGRLHVPHEVSAVSAACLAVETRKFESVGGFDDVNLPIEFNDIDLCLRLAERGWKTVCAADSVLIHRESATRGASLRTDEVYSQEHRYFRRKWINKLRDDPYFHPALSLDTLGAALG